MCRLSQSCVKPMGMVLGGGCCEGAEMSGAVLCAD